MYNHHNLSVDRVGVYELPRPLGHQLRIYGAGYPNPLLWGKFGFIYRLVSLQHVWSGPPSLAAPSPTPPKNCVTVYFEGYSIERFHYQYQYKVKIFYILHVYLTF